VFVQNEERLMRTLRDALDVEWNNLQDACIWVDAALSGQRQARDEDLARFKVGQGERNTRKEEGN
jgi:hypothetical protein